MRRARPAALAGALFAAWVLGAACGRLPRVVVLKDPLTPAEHLDLGLACERAGEPDRAIREYEAALRGDGRFFQARVNLGNVRAARKEYDLARKEYREALRIRPNDPEAVNNLAWIAVLSGEETGAALALMEETASRPGARSPRFLDTLGVLRMREGRLREAEGALSEAEDLCLSPPPSAPCPVGVLREIRSHRPDLAERTAAPAPAPVLII